MPVKSVSHTTFRNGDLFCSNCGGGHKLTMPIEVDKMTKAIEAFNVLHADCDPTWKEPVADQSNSIKEKAMWWIANGEKGMSSHTMWNCLMGNTRFPINYPYDPDDFSRCYKLLEIVPEWKLRIQELKSLSKQWSNLVDNWSKLTTMYEQNKREDWKNHKKIGMYEFMQTLIN